MREEASAHGNGAGMALTILVTGSAGFIGSAVVRKLQAAGHRVLGVDCLEPRVHRGGPSGFWSFMGHCADTPYSYIAESDCIIHLAAQVGVADSMTDPQRYVQDNTVDTAKFLQACESPLANRRKLRRLVVASSMSVYGDPGIAQPIDEHWPVHPASVYGQTKYDQEQLCLFWGDLHKVPVTALRFFNVYGPGQALHNPYTGVLANFANALRHGQRPTVYEDGNQTRDFIYVEDVAEAVVRCALGDPPHRVYNVCTGQATTITGIACQLADALDQSYLAPNITGEVRPGDIRHCVGDPARLQRDLPGWAPRTFPTGLREYATWLRSV